MFGKDKDSAVSSKMETIVGTQTIVQGTLASHGSIRIDGKLEGGITEAASVIIGENGEVQGDVNANHIIIGGKIIGNMIATTSLEILTNAKIHGDIRTSNLSIAEGATFEGNCIMTKEKQVIEVDVAATSGKTRR